ncbi:hypothetical protein POM88_032708 [Heracleum sosnowskyi]|uniref:Uncharacterized protein n=1 Tax=Heracleum sosnowskyi TaxID=360622 RepID=A0AAD8MHS4_9APIA|nr:hypothetical protein POM88_032708 [Heracleum sosnowskyi]
MQTLPPKDGKVVSASSTNATMVRPPSVVTNPPELLVSSGALATSYQPNAYAPLDQSFYYGGYDNSNGNWGEYSNYVNANNMQIIPPNDFCWGKGDAWKLQCRKMVLAARIHKANTELAVETGTKLQHQLSITSPRERKFLHNIADIYLLLENDNSVQKRYGLCLISAKHLSRAYSGDSLYVTIFAYKRIGRHFVPDNSIEQTLPPKDEKVVSASSTNATMVRPPSVVTNPPKLLVSSGALATSYQPNAYAPLDQSFYYGGYDNSNGNWGEYSNYVNANNMQIIPPVKKRLLKSQISLTEERRKRNITLLVEEVMAELEFVTEEDAP